MRWLLMLVPLLFAACSTPQHEDSWRYQAATATEAYAEHFLKDERLLVQSNYSHAERSARQSADLESLARLYLTRCALKRAVFEADGCEEAAELTLLLGDAGLSAYYAMLTASLPPEQISDLPPQYRRFGYALLSGDGDRICRTAMAVTPLRSRLVAAALVRDRLDPSDIETLIEDASHPGYRRAVLAWMRYLSDITTDPEQRSLLLKKLEYLQRQQ